MFPRLAALAAVILLLTGCAPQTAPTIDQSPTSTQGPAESGGDATDVALPKPSASALVKDDYYTFMNAMATTCIYAQGVGVTETVSTNGVLDGSLIMLPPVVAIDGSYTAGWIPAGGLEAEVVFESDAFDSCAIANMESLAKEAGQNLRKKVRVTYDGPTNSYTATVDFSGFSRTAKYQIGDGGIVYSVTGTDPQGQEIVTSMKFGVPKADDIAALTTAVNKLNANQ